ncbi:hypothetical protein [Geofilum rubicundum]|uniref:Outer membrane protein beta-barrel domain-containing protein n=1 Tax=Geofilum rubicundum JCM 15548 TaxID=1236989 RepID=A0A0E9LSQ1_9BACT|nr:hypothetical protein [Geofilum rubicundum]GAO27860.1 hypothetical protein JCM15548_14720 [Geofilum rubicundum JCM 15548]
MKKFTLFSLMAVLTFHSALSQTRRVREKVSEDKRSSSSLDGYHAYSSDASASESDSESSYLAVMLIEGLVYGIGYAGYGIYKGFWNGQQAVLQHRDLRPELVSLQISAVGGFDYQSNTFLASPAIRGNYGIFASDLRYINMSDVTGRLHSVDWQVLMLRLPIQSFKLEYGLGFSHFISPSKTYFVQSLGFDLGFLQNRAALQGQYRWSQKTSVGRYRQEYALDFDAEVARRGNLRFCPFVGYVHYQYFQEIPFDFIRLGMKIKLF